MLIRSSLPLRGRHQSSMYPASGDALEEQPFFMVAQTQTLHQRLIQYLLLTSLYNRHDDYRETAHDKLRNKILQET